MEGKFRLPLAYNRGIPPYKNLNLIQIVIVISSGILSSSVIATALKAWFDNRRTKLRIQIDGEMKSLEYEGHHLNQDAATIQIVLEKLSEEPNAAKPVDGVTIEVTYDGKKEQYVLESGGQQDNIIQDDSERAVMLRQPFRFNLKRLLPGWLPR
ncbi:MAG TPA: hypothetical protein VKR06_16860 [Ktedonosporobacter sp.]|nr:hypothetical protein [Ktedonosporobacter sp.]